MCSIITKWKKRGTTLPSVIFKHSAKLAKGLPTDDGTCVYKKIFVSAVIVCFSLLVQCVRVWCCSDSCLHVVVLSLSG